MTLAGSVCAPPKEQKFRGQNKLNAFLKYLYAEKLTGSLLFKNTK